MTNSNVETSFPLTNSEGLFDWPCCSSVKPFIDRQNLRQTKIHGLAEIFDKIDAIVSVSSQIGLKQLKPMIVLFVENLADPSDLVTGADYRIWSDDTPGHL